MERKQGEEKRKRKTKKVHTELSSKMREKVEFSSRHTVVSPRGGSFVLFGISNPPKTLSSRLSFSSFSFDACFVIVVQEVGEFNMCMMKKSLVALSLFSLAFVGLFAGLLCEENGDPLSCEFFEWKANLPSSDPLRLPFHPSRTFLPSDDDGGRGRSVDTGFFTLTKGLWRGQEWGFSKDVRSLWLPGATLSLVSPSSRESESQRVRRVSASLRTHLSSRLGISLDIEVAQSSIDGSPKTLRRQTRKTWYRVGQMLPWEADDGHDDGMMILSWPRERLCVDSIRRLAMDNDVWRLMERGLKEMGVKDVLDLMDMPFVGMKIEWDEDHDAPILRIAWVDCGDHGRGNGGNGGNRDAAAVPIVFKNEFHPRGSMCIYLPMHGIGDSNHIHENQTPWNVTILVPLPRSIIPLTHTLHQIDRNGIQGPMQQHPSITLSPSNGLIISANDVIPEKESAFCFDIEKRFLGAHDYGPFVYDGFIVPPTIVKLRNDQSNETWWTHSSALIIIGPRPDAGTCTILSRCVSQFKCIMGSMTYKLFSSFSSS
jgi:hypothetical protein